MATWQFDLHLIPRSELQQTFGFIPNKLDREAFNATNWWQNTDLPNGYREMLSAFAPVGSSWSEEIEFWGLMEGDRIEICREDKIDTVHIRVNVADLNEKFINGIAKFAQTCDCLLFTDGKELIEPIPEMIVKSVLKSNAARFVTNPREFFDKLEANGLEP